MTVEQNIAYLLIPFTNFSVFALLILGVILGIWVGAIPGLSITMAVSLLISFTFSWELNNAVALIIGVHVGGMYGGAITAILINIPGAPAAIVTGLDGYPLAQKGEAGNAIGLCTVMSVLTGLIGVVALAVFAPPLGKLALKFAPRDFFLLAIMGLLLIASIGGANPVKGAITGGLGILFSFVGMDMATAELRYTYGSVNLMGGLHYVVAMIGLFGVTEAMTQFRDMSVRSVKQDLRRVVPRWSTFVDMLPLAIRSSILGVGIGALPGTGGDVAALIAYDQAKRTVKNPTAPFGQGAIEGVVAPESANKGSLGGVYIPMLTLGIPGDGVTAIVIGALYIHGLKPGPMLMVETPHLFWMIVSLMTLGFLAQGLIGLVSIKPFAKIIETPKRIILPIIVILSVVGSYSIQNSLFDVFLMMGFGIFGYFLRMYGFATGPLILGMILGPILEVNFRRSLEMADDSMAAFLASLVTNPISAILVAAIVFSIFSQTSIYRRWRKLEA